LTNQNHHDEELPTQKRVAACCMLLEETCRFTTKVWALGPISHGQESGQIKINPITDPEDEQGSKKGGRSKGKCRPGAMSHCGTRESSHMNVRSNQTSAGWDWKRKLFMYCCNVSHTWPSANEKAQEHKKNTLKKTQKEKLDPTEQ